jgi:hypothetical protein
MHWPRACAIGRSPFCPTRCTSMCCSTGEAPFGAAHRNCVSAASRCFPSARRCMRPAGGWAIASRLPTDPRAAQGPSIQHLQHRLAAAIRRSRAIWPSIPMPGMDWPHFFQAKRDLLAGLLARLRHRARAAQGTYFQLVDYGALSGQRYGFRRPADPRGQGGDHPIVAVLRRAAAHDPGAALHREAGQSPARGQIVVGDDHDLAHELAIRELLADALE